MRWKWQNRQKFDEDKRRPDVGPSLPAQEGNLGHYDVMPKRTSALYLMCLHDTIC